MGVLRLGECFQNGVRNEEFFASDTDALASMLGINLRNMGLQPRGITLGLQISLVRFRQFHRVCYFSHDNGRCLVHGTLISSAKIVIANWNSSAIVHEYFLRNLSRISSTGIP